MTAETQIQTSPTSKIDSLRLPDHQVRALTGAGMYDDDVLAAALAVDLETIPDLQRGTLIKLRQMFPNLAPGAAGSGSASAATPTAPVVTATPAPPAPIQVSVVPAGPAVVNPYLDEGEDSARQEALTVLWERLARGEVSPQVQRLASKLGIGAVVVNDLDERVTLGESLVNVAASKDLEAHRQESGALDYPTTWKGERVVTIAELVEMHQAKRVTINPMTRQFLQGGVDAITGVAWGTLSPEQAALVMVAAEFGLLETRTQDVVLAAFADPASDLSKRAAKFAKANAVVMSSYIKTVTRKRTSAPDPAPAITPSPSKPAPAMRVARDGALATGRQDGGSTMRRPAEEIETPSSLMRAFLTTKCGAAGVDELRVWLNSNAPDIRNHLPGSGATLAYFADTAVPLLESRGYTSDQEWWRHLAQRYPYWADQFATLRRAYGV